MMGEPQKKNRKKDYEYYKALALSGSKSRGHRYTRRLYEGTFLVKTLHQKVVRGIKAMTRGVRKAEFGIDFAYSTHLRSKLADRIDVVDNRIFVMTFQKKLVCNPRYIVEDLLSRGDDYDIVICGDENFCDQFQPTPHVRAVERGTLDQFVEQASAKVWIDNAMNCAWFPMKKKPGQLYLQTWHGSMGLKRIGKETQSKRWLHSARHSVDYTDYVFSNSDFETDVYRETYWPTSTILLTGHARNDIFFDQEKIEAMRKSIFAFYDLPEDAHMAIYAPTFRDNPPKDNTFVIGELPFDELHKALEARFGGTWFIALRLHPRDKTKVSDLASRHRFLINANAYSDMQELMCACDLGITDYSSWICDFVLTKRPAFIFAPDREHYESFDRGFYYPLASTPFPLSESFDDLVADVRAFDEQKYAVGVEQFLKDRGSVEDGKASKRIGDIIERFTHGEPLDDVVDGLVTTRGLRQG